MTVCKCEAHQEFERMKALVESFETENVTLKQQLENISKKEKEKFSAYDQEIYSLKRKQELSEKCIQNCQEEIDALHSDQISSTASLIEEHKKALENTQEEKNLLMKELEDVRSEAAEVVVLRQEVITEKKLNEELKIQLQQQLGSDKEVDSSVAVVVDQGILVELKEQNAVLKNNLELWRNKEEEGQKKLKEICVREGDKEEELLKMASYNKTLTSEKERLQGENRVLKAKLDAGQAKPDHNRGNSLFSEVEDRRVEVEKKMIEMRLEIDSLKKKLKHSQDLLDDAKTHSLALWEGRELANADKRVAELEEDVYRLGMFLKQKVLLMNKKEDDHNLLVRRLQEEAVLKDSQATYSVHYSFHNDRVEKMRKELDQARLEHLTELQLVRTLRKQEFGLETELAVVKASEAGLRMRLKKLDSEEKNGISMKNDKMIS